MRSSVKNKLNYRRLKLQ